jgi:TolB protein
MLIKTSLGAAVAGLVLIAWAPAPPPATDITSAALQTPVQQQQPKEWIISLTGSSSRPKIGIPDLVVPAGNAALAAVAKQMAEVLAFDLDFEREFLVVSRSASASIPAAATIEALPLSRWADLGADVVLFGTLTETGGKLAVEVRMVNARGPVAGDSVGFTYDGCQVSNPRYCAHYISDDLHLKMRNVEGVARTRFAFTSDRDAQQMPGRVPGAGNQGKELYISDYDGANQQRLTVNRNLNITPKWGPDPRTLAYTSYVTGYQDIYVILLDGRAPTRPGAGNDDVHNMLPAISPDGSKVAFASTRGGTAGHWDIWVVNRDGSGLRNLTPGTANSTESAPTWSPSGTQIAFTSDRTGSNQIYTMNADGTFVQKITSETRTDRPAWSSLNYIAYTTERPGGQEIAIYDLNTGQSKILTDGKGANASPTVAPNGRHVAFVTSRWGREQVAMVDYPDGGNVRRVTEIGTNTYPSWSPSPRPAGSK